MIMIVIVIVIKGFGAHLKNSMRLQRVDFMKERFVFIPVQVDGLQALVDQQAQELNKHKVRKVILAETVTAVLCFVATTKGSTKG